MVTKRTDDNMKTQRKRDGRIDSIKAIAIVFMLIGHSAEFNSWIYLFNMSVFFVVAGYCMKDEDAVDSNTIKKYIMRRVKSLYIPCLICNSLMTLFHNFFVRIHLIYGERLDFRSIIIRLIKNLLFSGGDQLNGAMWFLRTMFFASIIYVFVEFVFMRFLPRFIEAGKTVVFLLILFSVWILPATIPGYKFLNIGSVMILFQLGHMIKKYCLINHYWEGVIGFVILYICFKQNVVININNNQIYNPFCFIVCAISGYAMCYGIARLLEILKLNKCFGYMGKHTLSIVIFHFLLFKLVTLVQIVIYQRPITDLTAYPVYIYTIGWRVLYVLVGILGSLGIYQCFTYLKRWLKSRTI